MQRYEDTRHGDGRDEEADRQRSRDPAAFGAGYDRFDAVMQEVAGSLQTFDSGDVGNERGFVEWEASGVS